MTGAFSFGSQGGFFADGTHTETYTFTPNDTADYTTVTDSVFVNVNPKAASVTPNAQSKATAPPTPSTGTLSGFLAGDGVTATSPCPWRKRPWRAVHDQCQPQPGGRAEQLQHRLQHCQLHHHAGALDRLRRHGQ